MMPIERSVANVRAGLPGVQLASSSSLAQPGSQPGRDGRAQPIECVRGRIATLMNLRSAVKGSRIKNTVCLDRHTAAPTAEASEQIGGEGQAQSLPTLGMKSRGREQRKTGGLTLAT